MDAKDIRNLQEAYNQVYQVDEELTGSRKEKASEILNKKLRDVETLRKLAARKRTQKTDYGSGNKAARRAGKDVKDSRVAQSDESYDYYDIILSHLLYEGYAETVEAAEVIMVNMSEEWRESIVEAVSGGSYYDLPGVVIRAASGAASKLLNRGQPPAAKPKPHPSDSKLVDVSTADKAAKNLPGSRVYNQRQQQQSR